MFHVNEYKIVFKRRWHEKRERQILFGGKSRISDNDGRYDTVCEIWIPEMEVPFYTGVANLHPNDKADKITGKKVALLDAMVEEWKEDPITKKKIPVYFIEFGLKSIRTEIWQAFRSWVSSWPNKAVKVKE